MGGGRGEEQGTRGRDGREGGKSQEENDCHSEVKERWTGLWWEKREEWAEGGGSWTAERGRVDWLAGTRWLAL